MEGRVRVAIVILVLVTFCPSEGTSSCNEYPVVLVPGFNASTIEARVKDDAGPPINESCRSEDHTWFTLWHNISLQEQCFADGMKLHYNWTSHDYGNTPGLETRIPNFGSPTTNTEFGTAMAKLVESLREVGYEDYVNLFGAPYDFRYGLAAEGHLSEVGTQFLGNLTELIEYASDSNGGKPVILLSHGLGGLFALQLLNRSSLAWRQQYIKHFIPLSTPWGGSVTTMLLFASGIDIGGIFDSFTNRTEIRDIARSLESILWLMPTPGAFDANTTLVETPTANYTAYNVSQFIGDTTGSPCKACRYLSRILPLVENLTAPEVNVTLITGSGLPTAEKLIYSESGFDQPPEIVYGDGDQLVNNASLLRIESEWVPQPKTLILNGVSHEAILTDDRAIDDIIGEICLINGNSGTESPALAVWTGKANA